MYGIIFKFHSYVVLPVMFVWALWLSLNSDGKQCFAGCEERGCNFATSICDDMILTIPNGTLSVTNIITDHSVTSGGGEKGKPGMTNGMRRRKPVSYDETSLALTIVLIFILVFCEFKFFGAVRNSRLARELINTLNLMESVPAERRSALAERLMIRHRKFFHFQGYRLWFLELLGVILVFGQLHVMESFTNGAISSVGSWKLVFQHEVSRWERTDTMYRKFPGLVECPFNVGLNTTFGYPILENDEGFDTLCAVPSNGLYEKMFLILYTWTKILAVFLIFRTTSRGIMTVSGKYREFFFRSRILTVFTSVRVLFQEVQKVSAGELWFLALLRQKVNPIPFSIFLEAYVHKLMEPVRARM